MFKMTERAKAVKIRRTWYCDICEEKWVTVTDPDQEDVCPDCPECASMPERVIVPFGVKTNASRAVEFAHKMAEQDYGLTDMKDHLQQGDISHKAPAPIQTSEAEAIAREILNAGGVPERAGDALQSHVQNFWGAGMAATAPQGPSLVPTSLDQARMMAAPAAQASKGMGADPVALLHEAGKKGADPVAKQNLKIHGSA